MVRENHTPPVVGYIAKFNLRLLQEQRNGPYTHVPISCNQGETYCIPLIRLSDHQLAMLTKDQRIRELEEGRAGA